MGIIRCTLLFAMCLFLLPAQTSATLDQLRRFQRKCYRDISPCVMFMNEQEAFGCGQCGDDVRSEPVREFRSLTEFVLFINGDSEKRIVMLSSALFFSNNVVAILATASRNVAAVIVYDGDIPSDASESGEEPGEEPATPLFAKSDDDTEPNRLYNFYKRNEQPRRCDPSVKARNPDALCFKFRFYPFNIFHVNATTADEIRNLTAKFPDQAVRPSPGGRNKTTPFSPRYKLDSVGQMFACPLQTNPSPTPDTASEESGTETQVLVKSEQCLREKTCLPVGGHSLWSSLGHMDSSDSASRNILAITAPMDSLAFFPEFSLGASAEITSLAVMMAVAEAVGKYSRESAEKLTLVRQPVYFAWNAQSWGYAGSSRFLKDVGDFKCEMEADLTNFNAGCTKPYMPSLKFLDFREAKFSVLNIGQMISPNDTDVPVTFKYFAHGRDPSNAPGEVESVLRQSFTSHSQFNETSFELGNDEEFTSFVPLDASQSFHRYRRGVDMITVANYETNFTNKFYHTAFDNENRTASPEALRGPMYAAADVIASSVAKLAFGATVSLKTNQTLIDEAVRCLTGNWSQCTLAREYLGDKYYEARAGNIIPGNYPGSFYPFTRIRDSNPSGAAKLSLLRSFFAFHNRYTVPESETSCETFDQCKDFIKDINTRESPQSQSQLRTAFCARGTCVASDTHTHNAFGTALNATNDAQSEFEYDGSKLQKKFDGSDPQEAGWTESVWDPELGLCSFVEDTPIFGGMILLAGILVLLVSVFLSLWLDKVMLPKDSQDIIEAEASNPGTASV